MTFMQFLETWGKELVALAVPFITLAITRLSRTRAVLQISKPHQFHFMLAPTTFDELGATKTPGESAITSSWMLQNTGKETAHKVELLFNWKPQFINVWPPRELKTRLHEDTRYTVYLDSLAPGEGIAIELLTIKNAMPDLLVARCDECTARFVAMEQRPTESVLSRRRKNVLAFLGAIALVYLVLSLLQFLVLATPRNF